MAIGARIGIGIGVNVGPAIGVSPLGSGGLVIATLGDSNDVGQMDTAKASPEFNITTPIAQIPYDMYYATSSPDPPTFIEFGPTTLRPYDGAPGAGFEITLGQTLLSFGIAPYIVKMALTGSTTSQWSPASTYMQASTGKNLYATWRDRVRSFLASTGRTLGAIAVNSGTNDASDGTLASQMSANMTAIVNQASADFPGVKIVWVETLSTTTSTFTSQVRTQQESYASTAPANFKLLNADYGTMLADGLHYDADTYVEIGVNLGFAIGDLLGVARRTVATTPACVGYGTVGIGSGNVTPRYWPGTLPGDTVYAYGHVSAVGSVTGTPADWTPAGWTLKASANAASSGVTIQYALFERQLSAGDFSLGRPMASTFLTPGPESAIQLFTWRGPNAHPTIDAVQSFVSNTFGTGPISPTGLTTATDHCAIAYFADAWVGSPPGAGVTVTAATGVANVVEIKDSTYQMPDGAGGTISLTTGELATHGTIGTSSVSYATNSVPAVITAAIKP